MPKSNPKILPFNQNQRESDAKGLSTKELMKRRAWKLDYLKSMEEKGFYLVKSKEELPDLIIGTIVKMPVSFLRPAKGQPRFIFEKKSLEELSESILIKKDVNNAIVVHIKKDERTGEYFPEIVGGERRQRASKIANILAVSCLIKAPMNEKDLFLESLTDNFGKRDLFPIEEALAVQRLETEFDFSTKEIARLLTRSTATIIRIKDYLNLTKHYQEKLIQSEITRGEASVISRWSEEDQDKIFEIIKKIKGSHESIHPNELDLRVTMNAQKIGLKKRDLSKKRGRKPEAVSTLATEKILRGLQAFKKNIIVLAKIVTEDDITTSKTNIMTLIEELQETKDELDKILLKFQEWS